MFSLHIKFPRCCIWKEIFIHQNLIHYSFLCNVNPQSFLFLYIVLFLAISPNSFSTINLDWLSLVLTSVFCLSKSQGWRQNFNFHFNIYQWVCNAVVLKTIPIVFYYHWLFYVFCWYGNVVLPDCRFSPI